MARRPIFSPICVEERLPLPPFPAYLLGGGRGRGGRAGSGWGRGGPSPPPLAEFPPIPAPRSWEGDPPPPRAIPDDPPRAKLLISSPAKFGWNMQCPAVAGSGPGSAHKISFYFPVSQRLSFPGFIPVRSPGVNCVLYQLEGLARSMRCVVFVWWRI